MFNLMRGEQIFDINDLNAIGRGETCCTYQDLTMTHEGSNTGAGGPIEAKALQYVNEAFLGSDYGNAIPRPSTGTRFAGVAAYRGACAQAAMLSFLVG